MTTRAGTEGEVKSPETIRYQRRRQLPGVELRTIFDSSRSYLFYSTGFEFFVPTSWRGEMWHQRRKASLEPGWILAAQPGDVYASKRVLQAGSWDSLTIDARSVVELVGERGAWDRVRLRPFSALSPRLGGHFQAVVQSLKSQPIDCVLAHLRSFLAAVADELLEVEAETPETLREGMPPALVAAELGLVDQRRFTRHFKRRGGVTPARDVRDIITTPTLPKTAQFDQRRR